MNKINPFTVHTATLNDFDNINQRLLEGLKEFIDDATTRKTHEFFGRYENIYIDTDKIPALSIVIEAVKLFSADILSIPVDELKAGLWFNVMAPGDKTTLHRHDDDDELLSAVYYVSTPGNSGQLHLQTGAIDTYVTPHAGTFVFFPPNMPHEVTENLSTETRVSLGINIGPASQEEEG